MKEIKNEKFLCLSKQNKMQIFENLTDTKIHSTIYNLHNSKKKKIERMNSKINTKSKFSLFRTVGVTSRISQSASQSACLSNHNQRGSPLKPSTLDKNQSNGSLCVLPPQLSQAQPSSKTVLESTE